MQQIEIKEITAEEERRLLVNQRASRETIIRQFSNLDPDTLSEEEKDEVLIQIRDFNYGNK